jgi:phosphoglycolate phosphatase
MNQPSTSAESPVQSGFDWMSADAYLFDIDGTLLVTRDLTHYNALNLAMSQVYGVDTTIDGVAYHGKTDLGILRASLARVGVSDAAFESGLQAALEIVCREVAAKRDQFSIDVCPVIPEVLNRLRDSGKLLGVASGNLESVGWQKIEAAGLREFFRFGRFSDHTEMRSDIFCDAVSEARRQLGEEATVCFVGDTPEDVRAAKIAGARIIGVCTGTFKMDEMSQLGADLCISSCTALLTG